MLQGVILACLVACIILQEKRFEELESEHSHLWNKVEDLTQNGLYSLHGWHDLCWTTIRNTLVLAIDIFRTPFGLSHRTCYWCSGAAVGFVIRYGLKVFSLFQGVLGHLPVLMWIKVHYNQNTFTGLKLKIDLNFFWIVKITKGRAVFNLLTYRFVVNAQTHCAKS